MEHNSIYRPSRIILAVETRLLREMLSRAIGRSPFLKVVAEVSNGKDLSTMVEQKEADWVFLSLNQDRSLTPAAESLLSNQPSVSIIAFAPDGSQAKLGWTEACESVVATAPDGSPIRLRWTESHLKVLSDLSLDELVSVMRKGATWELTIRDIEGISDVKRPLSKKRVAILVADGFEQPQLTRLLQVLRDTGAKTDIVSPTNETVRGWRLGEWGDDFQVDLEIESAKAEDYDGLLLPDGATSAEALSSNENAVIFVKALNEMGLPIVAIGCARCVLLEADIVKEQKLTSCEALRKKLGNAAADCPSQLVVVDNGLVTSQSPENLPELNRKMIEAFAQA